MSNIELKGTITKIGEIQTFASGFQKRELVLTTQEQYPQPISIDFLQDKLDLPDSHKVGDTVTVGINLRGRSWTSPQGETKYFNSIVGWKILKAGNNTNSPATADIPKPKSEPAINDSAQDSAELFDDDDDLPF